MVSAKWVLVSAGSLGVALAATTGLAERSPRVSSMPLVSSHQTTSAQAPATPRTPQTTAAPAAPDLTKIVPTYCINCHNDELKRGDLSFVKFDLTRASQNQEVVERMIRKLAAGMMPPPGSRRPTPELYQAFLTSLEGKMDTAAAARPNPGARVFQRLNRAEYARAVRDLLNLTIEAGSWLPLDSMSANFDNIADEQGLSATLLESYLNAAGDISRMAVGDRTAPAIDRTYTNTSYMSQHPWDQLEGAPHGTRGGTVVDHVFPADAEYVFAVNVISGDNTRLEDIDISIDGERVALIRYENGQQRDADGRGAKPIPTEPVFIKAGQHKVAATFVRRSDGPYEDSDSAARLVLRRRWLRRLGDHDAPASSRSARQGTVQDDGPLRDAQPEEDLQLPPDELGGGAALRANHRDAARRRSVPAAALGQGNRQHHAVLRRGAPSRAASRAA